MHARIWNRCNGEDMSETIQQYTLPLQPLYIDTHGVPRFVENRIVRYLVDQLPGGLNALAALPFSAAERMQLAQLIGYSLSGFGELSYVDDDTYEAAERIANVLEQ